MKETLGVGPTTLLSGVQTGKDTEKPGFSAHVASWTMASSQGDILLALQATEKTGRKERDSDPERRMLELLKNPVRELFFPFYVLGES